MAKKADKALKSLKKDVSKLQKQNEKLAKALEEAREEQAEALGQILDLLEEWPAVPDTTSAGSPQEDHSPDGDAEPEVTEAADRRAKELGVDPSGLKGTGSGGRVLVKDVEAAAEGGR